MEEGIFFLSKEETKKKLTEGRLNVSVFGLGYVGLPLAVAWCKAGAKVIGVTKNKEHEELLKKGISPFPEDLELKKEYKECYEAEKIEITSDSSYAAKNSDLKIIAVPVPYDIATSTINYSALEDVANNLGKSLKNGDIVDLESSVPPGTTEKILLKILEEKSKLKLSRNFGLVYSPERIYIGRALKDLRENYPKIIGSSCKKSLEIMSVFYEQISKKGVILLNSFIAAELEKLFEGVYRDVNIALANELANICEKMNISYEEVRKAANSQPYCHLHQPGIGVGGFCLPNYSNYIIAKAKELNLEVPVIENGRKENEKLPFLMAKNLIMYLRSMLELENINILVLGLTFRGNTSDTRYSPAIDFVNTIVEKVKAVYVYDPFVKRPLENLDKKAKIVENLSELKEKAEVLCIATDHEEFKKLLSSNELIDLLKDPKIIVDFKVVINNETKAKLEAFGAKVFIRGEPVSFISGLNSNLTK
ncbi:MAG: nucleotide sugar dehydrogenase [Candidatus Brockarchaeota archaeon]|nr:nucleotide sugar dehydrogenase [Candidatus Brockarchaeota archaeon]MBO3768429.1 nucleotide sugar dehydrogenase [Candidatus Brockarchaeota archaeon]